VLVALSVGQNIFREIVNRFSYHILCRIGALLYFRGNVKLKEEYSMNIYNFEEKAMRVALDKGRDYYQSGKVSSLQKHDNGSWTAIVHSSEDYHIKIKMNGDEIRSCICDCPYSDKVCKHSIAVLFAIRAYLLSDSH
jgi:uncharacterized Zn finger protein